MKMKEVGVALDWSLNADWPSDYWLSQEEAENAILQIQFAEDEDEKSWLFSAVWHTYKAFIVGELASHFNTIFFQNKDELLEEAALYIWEELPKYDPEKGMVSTFLRTRALHAGSLYTAKLGQVSRYYGECATKIKRAIRDCEAEGLAWDENTLSIKTGLPIRSVCNTMERLNANAKTSYDAEKHGAVGADTAEDLNPEQVYLIKEETKAIREMVGNLSKEERLAISMAFGFDGREYTLTEIARKLGVSTGKANQILNSAKGSLKLAMLKTGLVDHIRRTEEDNNGMCQIILMQQAV